MVYALDAAITIWRHWTIGEDEKSCPDVTYSPHSNGCSGCYSHSNPSKRFVSACLSVAILISHVAAKLTNGMVSTDKWYQTILKGVLDAPIPTSMIDKRGRICRAFRRKKASDARTDENRVEGEKEKRRGKTQQDRASFSFFNFLQFFHFFTFLVDPSSSSLLPPHPSYHIVPLSSWSS